jgi:hypothetical protein
MPPTPGKQRKADPSTPDEEKFCVRRIEAKGTRYQIEE